MIFGKSNPAYVRSIRVLILIILVLGMVWFLNHAKNSEVPDSLQPALSATATSIWQALQERTPVPFLTPLPAAIASPLDGTFAKLDESPPQWWKCVRCADYRVVGGIWKLQFEQGVMRIFYDVTGWRSIASFTVSDDHLYIFNDPYCPQVVGEYGWRVIDGQLELRVIEDTCAFDLRAENLTNQAWSTCPLPAQDAADTPGPTPIGCSDNPVPPGSPAQSDLPVIVIVHGGDSRFFEKPPDVTARANASDTSTPEGVAVTVAQDSISYGVHRVLWWNGNWIEASTDQPFSAMGVQFFGEYQIGWARVLFDGEEVWRGNTSAIWSRNGRTGGYIEISGFSAGKHTIRAESLDFDYRPVTVVSFGFNYKSGVETGEP